MNEKRTKRIDAKGRKELKRWEKDREKERRSRKRNRPMFPIFDR